MIFHEVVQQSPDWFKMRLGVATASCFGQIITPKTAEPSKSMGGYANQLIGEVVTGENSEKFQSYWMERGAVFEAEAAAAYEAITGYTTIPGGFITDDEMLVGASPDRIIIDGNGEYIGALEIKCPSPAVHIENLLRANDQGEIDPAYIPQVQGQILIGGLGFQDWFSYHPDMIPALIRTQKDEEYCEKMAQALEEFIILKDDKISQLKKIGMIVPENPIIQMRKQATGNQFTI